MSDLSHSAFPSNAVTLKDGHPVTNSLIVAQVFGRLHKNVLRDIDSLECSKQFRRLNFEPTSREIAGPNGGTRSEPYVEITRDGFTFLVMGFTGRQAAVFKESYIRAFNVLEAEAIRAASIPPAEYQALRGLLLAANARAQALEGALLASQPRYAALARYVRLGLSDTECARILQRGRTTVRTDRRRLEACGILPTAVVPTTGDLFAEVAHG